MPLVGFEPTTLVFEKAKTVRASDRVEMKELNAIISWRIIKIEGRYKK
jgi:hypothetical protein